MLNGSRRVKMQVLLMRRKLVLLLISEGRLHEAGTKEGLAETTQEVRLSESPWTQIVKPPFVQGRFFNFRKPDPTLQVNEGLS